MNKIIISVFLQLLLIILMSSCKKDKLRPINQQELITSVIVTLIDSATGMDTVKLSFEDIDGDGGSDPVITAGNLSAHTTYNASILLSDESTIPITNVSNEILEEGDDHQFFFLPTPGSLFSNFNYLDSDINGQPIGLQFRTKTGDTGSGNLTIILRHQPNKNGIGVNEGDITNAAGETDAEVTYPISIL